MSHNFYKLRDELSRSEEETELRRDRFHAVVYKVLEGVGFNIKRVGIEGVYLHEDKVTVAYGWSSRGLKDSNDITLPLHLFLADDPLDAAKEYQEAEKKAETLLRRKNAEAEIKRLQESLSSDN